MADVLQVEHLSAVFDTPQGTVQAVRDVSFTVAEGEVLAIVGESGCGKSALCRAIMGLLPRSGHVTAGRIVAGGQDITDYSERQLCALRGDFFSMILQDPMTALDPTMTVGAQIAEAVRLRQPKAKKTEVARRVAELLTLVGIDQPEIRQRQYPHQFSGGMRQRAALAIALAGEPKVLFADEPTTALDVTMQSQILALLQDVQHRLSMATVFVTHDLGVVARIAHRVAVMYAGKIVEIGTAEEIFHDPRHPYTWALLRCLPSLHRGEEKLPCAAGMPPSLIHPPKGDAFARRSEYALAIDYEEEPPLLRVSDTHYAATWLLHPDAPNVTREGGVRHDG